MTAEVNLWQKSRRHVTEITGAFGLDCDVYHHSTCTEAQRPRRPKPSIGTCQLYPLYRFLVPKAFARHPINF